MQSFWHFYFLAFTHNTATSLTSTFQSFAAILVKRQKETTENGSHRRLLHWIRDRYFE